MNEALIIVDKTMFL